ncbi:unnamed protein product [Protopolystoma xenopodis]|uniref:Uncharacterized protein n=1 Tax=Protopolystoma xenopodis TaxID=117903 RepID=A0A3S5ALQ5_9PLAT|nr:unnamed protein product [Protopolystoma xenopodis]
MFRALMEATGSNETKLLLSWVFKSRICTATSGLLSPREAEVSQSGHLLASCDPNDPVVPPSDRILQRVLAFSESREELLCLVYDKKTEEQSFLALDIRNVSCPKESWSFPQPLASYRQPRHSRSRLNTALTTAAAYDHMTSNFIALLLPEPFIASSAAAIASNGGDALAPDFSSALSEPVVGCILRPPKLMQRLPTTAKQRPDLQFFLCSPISVLGQPIVDDRPESKAFIASSLAWALQDSILISALPTGSLVYWRLPSETHTPLLFQQHRHFPEHSSDSSTPSELYNDSKVDMRPMSIVCRPLLMHPYHTISPSSCIASKAEGDNGNIAALGKLLVLLSVSPLDTSLLASAVFPCSVKESSSDCPVAPHGAGAGGRVHLWRLRILAGENAGFAADLLAICSPHCEIDLSRKLAHGQGTFQDVSPASESSVGLEILMTDLQLVKESSGVDPLTN